MARNATSAYGRDVDTWDDADDLFTPIEGLDAVAQDLYHRFTNDTILDAVDPDAGADWGKDITKLVGMPAEQLTMYGPVLSEVATRDPRIDAADVRVSAEKASIGGTLYDGSIDITCYTALGPFRRVFAFSASTVADITAILDEAEQ